MRRETRDEILRGFLAINAVLRNEVKALRREIGVRSSEEKHNPNWALQARIPSGNPKGGEWTTGGPKQARTSPLPAAQPRPARPAARPQTAPLGRPPGRLAIVRPQNGSPVQLSLRLTRVSPLLLATTLAGSTPQPTLTSRFVPGTHDLLVVVSENLQLDYRSARFVRIIAPERRVPVLLFGIDTGLTRVEPPELEWLNVDVALQSGDISFNPTELARAYGRDIPGVTTASDSLEVLVTYTWEEADMTLAMRLQGRPLQQIQTALDAVRRNRSAFRNNAGIAFSSRALPSVQRRWLGTNTTSAEVPEQVAAQLRGRAFANADEFRRAFWMAVANSDLVSQFNSRDLQLMRLGFAPIVENAREHYGGRRTYMIHHRRTIASGGAVYDMSNMLIVTPNRHQDILPPSEHFGRPGTQRRRDTDE